MNKQIKAYIFDMDGTLVDNCAYHVKAWRKFSKKYGHELTEREILDWMGAQGGYYIERIMGKPLTKEEVDRLCFEKEEIYRKIYKPKLPEGLREWLDYAHARKIKLALATGGPKENVAFILDSLDLRKDFEVIVDATMYEKSKHVEIPIVPRGIYHNNPGLLAPLDDFPELKRAKTGDLVAEKLRIQEVRELSTRAANKPAKPKSFTPKTFKPKTGRGRSPSAPSSALSFFDKVRKHRIEFFKKNGK